MVAVLALALAALSKRNGALCQRALLGTTAWLADEQLGPERQPALGSLLDRVSKHFGVSLCGWPAACGFHTAPSILRDYEQGYVKEGVGAGALLLLAQLQGTRPQ